MEVTVGRTRSDQILFMGPFGVGKTTALRAISDIPVTDTDVASLEITGSTRQTEKTMTTVGFDYGEIHTPEGIIGLVGLPGQDRFDRVIETMVQSSSAVLVWAYGDHNEGVNECKFWLDFLQRMGATGRMAVVVTRTPADASRHVIGPFQTLVSQYNPLSPVITGDPRNPKHVVQAVLMATATAAVIESDGYQPFSSPVTTPTDTGTFGT